MLVPMAKIQIIGYRARLEATLDLLHSLRAVQLIDLGYEPDPALRAFPVEEEHTRRADALHYLRARLTALTQLLPAPQQPEAREPADEQDDSEASVEGIDLQALRQELDDLTPQVEALGERLDTLRAEQEALPRHIDSIRRLLPLVPELSQLERFETVALLLERRHAGLLRLLAQELEQLVGDQFHMVTARVDAHSVGAVLVFPRPFSHEVDSLLGRERVSQVRLPSEFEGLPLSRAITAMEQRLADLPALIERARETLRALLMPHRKRWKRAERVLSSRLDQLSELRKLAATDHTFVIQGWIVQGDLGRLRRALAERIGRQVLLIELPMSAADVEDAPILLSNPRIARPFEMLVRLFSLPHYRTFDPTVLMSIFIPLFFGLMLGDVGYGLLLLGGSLAVRRRWGRRSEGWRDLSSVVLMGAISAIGFGIAFGELFGNLGRSLGMRPLWLDREHALGTLLLLAIAIGAAHIALSMVLGVWLSLRSRQRSVLAERAGKLVGLIGLLFLAGWAADRLPSGFLTPAVAGLLVGLVILLRAHGGLGLMLAPLELVGMVGNVLSYLRLAALGLASVLLARTANELGAIAPLWLGVVIAALFHTLNLALGTFSPTVQALRLHYVEFFKAFYETGRGPFRPFGEARSD